MAETDIEKRFWRYWLFGLLLLAAMIAMNPALANNVAPLGIADHQSAGTAARIDAIQRQWQADGLLLLARASMAIDLLFIAVYSWGAWNGGRMMRQATAPGIRRIGLLVMIAAVLFLVTDYAETIAQFIQLLQMAGNDRLAALAATAQPIKSFAWIVTFVGLLVALALRRIGRK